MLKSLKAIAREIIDFKEFSIQMCPKAVQERMRQDTNAKLMLKISDLFLDTNFNLLHIPKGNNLRIIIEGFIVENYDYYDKYLRKNNQPDWFVCHSAYLVPTRFQKTQTPEFISDFENTFMSNDIDFRNLIQPNFNSTHQNFFSLFDNIDIDYFL